MRLATRKSDKDNLQPVDLHITPEKYDEFKRLHARLKEKRPRLAEEVKRLAEMGDFSENAAYQISKGRLRGLNNRLRETEYALNHAVIISPTGTGVVELGSTVMVEVNGTQKTFRILGSAESDPTAGVISHSSPIGAALLGRRAGERVSVKLKDREVVYTIMHIGARGW